MKSYAEEQILETIQPNYKINLLSMTYYFACHIAIQKYSNPVKYLFKSKHKFVKQKCQLIKAELYDYFSFESVIRTETRLMCSVCLLLSDLVTLFGREKTFKRQSHTHKKVWPNFKRNQYYPYNYFGTQMLLGVILS